jgi:hypothetical protein
MQATAQGLRRLFRQFHSHSWEAVLLDVTDAPATSML